MRRSFLILALIFAHAGPAIAGDNIDQIDQLVQADFRRLSQDLGAALSYKAVIPAEPLGLTGFDIGVEVTVIKLTNPEAFDRASSGTPSSTLYLPKLHLHKGLPLGFDLGVFYTSDPKSNIEFWGAEVRYALVEGGVAVPALGLRGTYTKLQGVDQLDFATRGLELTISKGFAFFTPYAGVGRIWSTSTPVNVTNVTEEKFAQNKYYLGLNMNFGIGNFVIEGDKTGDTRSYNAKFGWRF
jgi:hypothetical protein